MRYIAILAGLMILNSSCHKEKKEPNYTILSGKIHGTDAKEFIVEAIDDMAMYFEVRENTPVKKVALAIDGSFRDTIYNCSYGTYELKIGNKPRLHLENGYDLYLEAQADDIKKTITFKGVGSEPNQYMSLNSLAYKSYNSHYKLEEKDFVRTKDSVKKLKLDFLNAIQGFKTFVDDNKIQVGYEYVQALYNYPGFHRSFTKNRSFQVSDEYPLQETSPLPIKRFDYNNNDHFKKSVSYRNLVSSYHAKKIGALAKEKGVSFYDVEKEYLKNQRDSMPPVVLNYLVEISAARISDRKPKADNQAIYEDLMALTLGNDYLQTMIRRRYDKVLETINKLAKGSPSPKFANYENHAGGTVSLDDFKGKYVFIDFWATWCGPCIKEFPHLKMIEKKYHNSNIVFVGISTDAKKDHEKWRKMVTNKQLGGVQLLANDGSYSKFYQEYGITSIPRFILIDSQGNIVSADAPRPSDPKLIELFKEEGI